MIGRDQAKCTKNSYFYYRLDCQSVFHYEVSVHLVKNSKFDQDWTKKKKKFLWSLGRLFY